MKQLLRNIKNCTICKGLPLGPRPVISVSPTSKILIIGQAPGVRVHNTGIPWNDPSGERLREWLQMDAETFYDNTKVGIMPMGFCYPGTGKTGDLPPRKECAPKWHSSLIDQLPELQCVILIGQYAQKYYLGKTLEKNLTQTVQNYKNYLPNYFVLPHPSPRNNIWIKKNPWFEKEVLPDLRKNISHILKI